MFNLRRPYDLVALLKQEERAVMLQNLKQELLDLKQKIDDNEDKDTGKIAGDFEISYMYVNLLLCQMVYLVISKNIFSLN